MVKPGDLKDLSDEPRWRKDFSAFAGLSLTRADTTKRSAAGPIRDLGAEERALARDAARKQDDNWLRLNLKRKYGNTRGRER